MKKFTAVFFSFLLMFSLIVPSQFISAQNNADFDEIIQQIKNNENLSAEEKEEVFDDAIDLVYEKGASTEEIGNILSQNSNFDDIENEFNILDDMYEDDMNDDDDMDDDDMDDDDDYDDDDDDDMDDDDDDDYDDDDDDDYDDDDDDMDDDDDDDDYDDDDDDDDDDERDDD